MDALAIAGLVLLLVGFVGSLILAVAPGPPRWLSVSVAGALGFQALDLVLLARQGDPYFAPDHVTRWEFADTGQPFVVVAIVAVLASAVGLLVGVVLASGRITRVAALAGAVSFVLALMASFVLTVGH